MVHGVYPGWLPVSLNGSSGSQWLPVIVNSFQWLSVVSMQWFTIVTSGSQWLPVAVNSFQWFPVVHNGHHWLPVVPGSFLWFPMHGS